MRMEMEMGTVNDPLHISAVSTNHTTLAFTCVHHWSLQNLHPLIPNLRFLHHTAIDGHSVIGNLLHGVMRQHSFATAPG